MAACVVGALGLPTHTLAQSSSVPSRPGEEMTIETHSAPIEQPERVLSLAYTTISPLAYEDTVPATPTRARLLIDEAGAITDVRFPDSVEVPAYLRTRLRDVFRRWGYTRLIEITNLPAPPPDSLWMSIDWSTHAITVDATGMISQSKQRVNVTRLMSVQALDVREGNVGH